MKIHQAVLSERGGGRGGKGCPVVAGFSRSNDEVPKTKPAGKSDVFHQSTKKKRNGKKRLMRKKKYGCPGGMNTKAPGGHAPGGWIKEKKRNEKKKNL